MRNLPNFKAEMENEKGITAVYVALLLFVFFGVAALAIDVGYHRVVRNQLQNAADAAALAACNRLYDREVVTFPASPPDWAAASAEGDSAITLNSADNNQLSTGTIETGWWDTTQSPPGILSPTSSTNPVAPPNLNYGPGVRVTIAKTVGQNDGPIANFFGPVLGVSTTNASASATAVAASPGSVRPDAVVPVALARDVVNGYYDDYDDMDHLIAIGSPYMYPNSLAGQWTSFNLDRNDVRTVRELIEGGNPTAINCNDNIWIQPGVEDTLYDNRNQPSINNTYAGEDIVFPIVDAILRDNTHSSVPVTGFVGFHIVCAGDPCQGRTVTINGNQITIGNNEKVILGYFTTAPSECNGPVGPHYGPLDLCRLRE